MPKSKQLMTIIIERMTCVYNRDFFDKNSYKYYGLINHNNNFNNSINLQNLHPEM